VSHSSDTVNCPWSSKTSACDPGARGGTSLTWRKDHMMLRDCWMTWTRSSTLAAIANTSTKVVVCQRNVGGMLDCLPACLPACLSVCLSVMFDSSAEDCSTYKTPFSSGLALMQLHLFSPLLQSMATTAYCHMDVKGPTYLLLIPTLRQTTTSYYLFQK
jgi:hypothetical protein